MNGGQIGRKSGTCLQLLHSQNRGLNFRGQTFKTDLERKSPFSDKNQTILDIVKRYFVGGFVVYLY